MNLNLKDFITIVKSLEYLGVSVDGVTEPVKHQIKKQEGGFLGALLGTLAASVIQPVISSVVKGFTERGVMRVERGFYNNMNKIFKFRSIL